MISITQHKTNGWLLRTDMVPLTQLIQDKIKGDPTHYIKTNPQVDFKMKYLNMRIDMRTGEFMMSADTPVDQVKFDPESGGEYPDGYDKDCGASPESVKFALDIMRAMQSPFVDDVSIVKEIAGSIESMANRKLQYSRSNRNMQLSADQIAACLGLKLAPAEQ